jgi:DNA-binding CsgD family transcriptional regulator
MLENAALLKRLSEPGITSVVNKADDLSHIGLAVQHVSRYLEYMSPSVKASLETFRMNAGGKTDEAILSKHELEVVRLFVSGMTIKEISEQLNRSIKTISTQKNTAMRKLGLEGDSERFQYAQSNGLSNLSSNSAGSWASSDRPAWVVPASGMKKGLPVGKTGSPFFIRWPEPRPAHVVVVRSGSACSTKAYCGDAVAPPCAADHSAGACRNFSTSSSVFVSK